MSGLTAARAEAHGSSVTVSGANPSSRSATDDSGRSLNGRLTAVVREPGAAFRKILEWANAKRQLRACDSVGSLVRVTGPVVIANYGSISIGNRVRFYANHARSILTTHPGGRLVIGDNTAINYGADIVATGLVQIGSDVMIGTHVFIMDNDFHDPIDHNVKPAPKPVVIGDGVWIGNRSIVLPGVTIGERAVVGAGSVVMTDIPPRTLALGNPARVIKRL